MEQEKLDVGKTNRVSIYLSVPTTPGGPPAVQVIYRANRYPI